MTTSSKPEPKASELGATGRSVASSVPSVVVQSDADETATDSEDTPPAELSEPVNGAVPATSAAPGSETADSPSSGTGPGGSDAMSDETPSKSERRAKRGPAKGGKKPRAGLQPNNVRKLRQDAMMSKAELARRAGVSPLTIDRVEAGCPCRMDTKRKILEALGLSPSARAEVWPDIDKT